MWLWLRLKLRGGVGNPDNRVMFDEFRLATTYEDVTPIIPLVGAMLIVR